MVAMRILQTCYGKLGPIGKEDGSIDVVPVIVGLFLLLIFTGWWGFVVVCTVPTAVGVWRIALAYEEVKVGGGDQRADEGFMLQTVSDSSEGK